MGVLGLADITRVAVGAIASDKALTFPSAAIAKIWEAKLLPLKKQLSCKFGIRMTGVTIRPDIGSPSHRKFSEILQERGYDIPLGHGVRFLVSDGGWEDIPELAPENPLMILVEISTGDEGWLVETKAPMMPKLRTTEANLPSALADVALDLSVANSFYFTKFRTDWSGSTMPLERFLSLKAYFAAEKYGTEKELPYIAFSALARKNSKFGSDAHLTNFVQLYDEFFQFLSERSAISKNQTRDAICGYPNFGGQLSPTRVEQALAEAGAGQAILIVERKSPHFQSKKFSRDILSSFSQADIRGRGGKLFGFYNQKELPKKVQTVVENGAAYALRVFVGES